MKCSSSLPCASCAVPHFPCLSTIYTFCTQMFISKLYHFSIKDHFLEVHFFYRTFEFWVRDIFLTEHSVKWMTCPCFSIAFHRTVYCNLFIYFILKIYDFLRRQYCTVLIIISSYIFEHPIQDLTLFHDHCVFLRNLIGAASLTWHFRNLQWYMIVLYLLSVSCFILFWFFWLNPRE